MTALAALVAAFVACRNYTLWYVDCNDVLWSVSTCRLTHYCVTKWTVDCFPVYSVLQLQPDKHTLFLRTFNVHTVQCCFPYDLQRTLFAVSGQCVDVALQFATTSVYQYLSKCRWLKAKLHAKLTPLNFLFSWSICDHEDVWEYISNPRRTAGMWWSSGVPQGICGLMRGLSCTKCLGRTIPLLLSSVGMVGHVKLKKLYIRLYSSSLHNHYVIATYLFLNS